MGARPNRVTKIREGALHGKFKSIGGPAGWSALEISHETWRLPDAKQGGTFQLSFVMGNQNKQESAQPCITIMTRFPFFLLARYHVGKQSYVFCGSKSIEEFERCILFDSIKPNNGGLHCLPACRSLQARESKMYRQIKATWSLICLLKSIEFHTEQRQKKC